jgi:hypothetical protein
VFTPGFCELLCSHLGFGGVYVAHFKTRDEDKQNKGQSSIDNLETLATLGTEDTGRRQTKQGAIKHRQSTHAIYIERQSFYSS